MSMLPAHPCLRCGQTLVTLDAPSPPALVCPGCGCTYALPPPGSTATGPIPYAFPASAPAATTAPASRVAPPGSWAFITGGIFACLASLHFLRIPPLMFMALLISDVPCHGVFLSLLSLFGLAAGATVGGLSIARFRWFARLSIAIQVAMLSSAMATAIYLEVKLHESGRSWVGLAGEDAILQLVLSGGACVFTWLALRRTAPSNGIGAAA